MSKKVITIAKQLPKNQKQKKQKTKRANTWLPHQEENKNPKWLSIILMPMTCIKLNILMYDDVCLQEVKKKERLI